MIDLTGGAGLLGQVEGRTAVAVSQWIDAQSATWRAGVRVVAIDMCTVFKAAVRDSLPHVTLVVDRFHAAQPANAAHRGPPPRHCAAARTARPQR